MATMIRATCTDCGYTRDYKSQALAECHHSKHSCDHQLELQARAVRVEARKADEGVKVDCTHKRARHEHGTRTAYVLDKCRCRPCRDAAAAAETRRARLKAYGRYDDGRTDAAPVRAHLLQLMDYGIGLKRVSKLTGVSTATLGKIIYGVPSKGIKPRRQTDKTVADRILAVKPVPENLAPGQTVDPTGTRRRLEALVAIGWSQARLDQMLGMGGNIGMLINGRRDTTARTARTVKDLYDEIWNEAPTAASWREQGGINRARRYAVNHGWAPPLAWDEDTIDDPAAAPDLGEEAGRKSSDYRAEETEFLLDAGTAPTEIPARLGCTVEALEKALNRAGRQDLANRIHHALRGRKAS